MEQWPESGVPDNPGAWLAATARNRAVDRIRRDQALRRKTDELGHMVERGGGFEQPPPGERLDEPVDDDLLRLVFTTCHPVLSTDARVALTLRLLGGLTTAEIASAFLVPEPTVAQRIVRAKRTLAAARVPFDAPSREQLPERLGDVLEVVYLIFNEGYAASSGDRVVRSELIEEALRMGRILASLMPAEPEVHGLLALMELSSSRVRARVPPEGSPVLLADQDRGRWDWLLIERGLAGLERAATPSGALGPYALQASIAACHARARTPEQTDWELIVALYDGLAQVTPSPVVALNRAVAVGMAYGPAAALELVDALAAEPALRGYHLLPSVRGDLLERLGRGSEAADEFARAAEIAANERVATLLAERSGAARNAKPSNGLGPGLPGRARSPARTPNVAPPALCLWVGEPAAQRGRSPTLIQTGAVPRQKAAGSTSRAP